MAKYTELFEDVQALFTTLIANADLERVLNIKVLADDKQKQVGKVVKCSPIENFKTNDHVNIIINQKIFEQLTPELQVMQAEELLAGIHWDYEKDRLILNKGDITTYSGLLRKYGYTNYEVLKESIKTLYDAANNEEVVAE